MNIIFNVIIAVFLFLLFKKELSKDFKNFKKEYIPIIIKNWAIISIFNFIFVSIIGTSTNEDIISNNLNNNLLLLLIPLSIFGPFIEEMIYRFSLKHLIKKEILFILISSLLFGLSHIVNISDYIHIINYGFMGFILAYTYTKYNNIFIPISIHILNNFLAIIMPLIISLLK